MRKVILCLSLMVMVTVFLIRGPNFAFAQDSGKPALQTLAFYTVGGSLAGVFFGLAYWALDPLAPSADLRGSTLQGMGAGSFIGFIFGIMQLNRQAVLPYEEPYLPTDGFQGNLQYQPSFRQPSYEFSRSPFTIRKGIPLIQVQYRF